MDGWMEGEREGESVRGREDAAGIEGWIWREVCVCVLGGVGVEVTEGGNHSAIRALSLGPVFITVQLL